MRILLNSLPKSGTNYLESILTESGYKYSTRSLTARGLTSPYKSVKRLFRGRYLFENNFVNIGIDFTQPFSLSYVESQFDQLKKNQYLTAHANYTPILEALIKEKKILHIIMIRHPRDVLRSYIDYAKRNKKHLHHAYHCDHTVPEIVMRHVTGGKVGPYYLDPWHVRLERVSKWSQTDALFIKYEDLLLSREKKLVFGGTRRLQRLLKIDDLISVISATYGKSKTFNVGVRQEKWKLPLDVSVELARVNRKFCETFDYED